MPRTGDASATGPSLVDDCVLTAPGEVDLLRRHFGAGPRPEAMAPWCRDLPSSCAAGCRVLSRSAAIGCISGLAGRLSSLPGGNEVNGSDSQKRKFYRK